MAIRTVKRLACVPEVPLSNIERDISCPETWGFPHFLQANCRIITWKFMWASCHILAIHYPPTMHYSTPHSLLYQERFLISYCSQYSLIQ